MRISAAIQHWGHYTIGNGLSHPNRKARYKILNDIRMILKPKGGRLAFFSLSLNYYLAFPSVLILIKNRRETLIKDLSECILAISLPQLREGYLCKLDALSPRFVIHYLWTSWRAWLRMKMSTASGRLHKNAACLWSLRYNGHNMHFFWSEICTHISLYNKCAICIYMQFNVLHHHTSTFNPQENLLIRTASTIRDTNLRRLVKISKR